jgi:acyl-coenzyme A thioesterase PaaI-like protein
MERPFIPFRIGPDKLRQQLLQFNARREVQWFGFSGSLQAPGTAIVSPQGVRAGALGGGGTDALNGGVIAAGFDAAFVLAGLTQYESEVVVTLELSVQFLSLARIDRPLAFMAGVVRSSRHFSYVRGILAAEDDLSGPAFATATGMVAPAKQAVMDRAAPTTSPRG